MKISIRIAGETIESESRFTVHQHECLEIAKQACQQAKLPFIFTCGCGHPVVPFIYKEGYRFRRARICQIHKPPCGLFRIKETPQKRRKEMFRGMRKAKQGPQSPGLGVSIGEPIPRQSETIATFASELLCHAYRAAHISAQKKGGEYAMPTGQDFIDGIRSAISELDFDGQTVTQTLARQGLTFKVAVGYLPQGAIETWTEQAHIFLTSIPPRAPDPIANEFWSMPAELLASGVPMPKNANGNRSYYWGAFLAIGACRPTGEFTDFQLVPAFRSKGVYGSRDSSAEADLARHFDALKRVYFRTAQDTDIPLMKDLLGIRAEIALNLRHRPDFVCPQRRPIVTFVEATSYSKGAIAREHSEAVIARIEHYFAIGLGLVEVELWQLSGPVPEHIGTIRNQEDLGRLREIIKNNRFTGINV